MTYDKSFGQHSFNVVLGQSASRYTSRALNGTRYDLPAYLDDKANIDFATGLASDGKQTNSGGLGDPNSLASYFGRLSYNYAERYMLQFTVRRDGSSRFGSNNKWGTFPSVSLGWNITNESFLEKRFQSANYNHGSFVNLPLNYRLLHSCSDKQAPTSYHIPRKLNRNPMRTYNANYPKH